MASKGYVSNVDVRSDNYNLKDTQARVHIQDRNNPHRVTATQLGLDDSYKNTTPSKIQEDTISALLNKLAIDYNLSKTTIINLRQQIQDILESPTMDVSHKLDKFEEGQIVEKSVEFEEGISVKGNQIMYDSESQSVEFGVDVEQKPIQNWNFNGTLMQNDTPVITSISATSQSIESSGNATVLVERGKDGVVNFRFLIPKGPAGQGLPGDKGDPGVTYYPTVTDGYLSWDIYDPEVHTTYPETVDIRGAYFKPYLRVEYIYKKDEEDNNVLDENEEPIIESTKYYLCWDNNKGLANPDDMELPIPKAPAQYYPTMETEEDEENITSFTIGWENNEGLNNPDPVTISLPNKKSYYTKEEMDEKLEQSSLSSGNITGKRLRVWKGELTTSDFNDVDNYITLSKDMTKFDEIIIVASFNYNGAVGNLFGDATFASTNTNISWSHPISKEILDGQPFASSFYTYSNAGVQICCEFTGVNVLHFKHIQQTWHTKTTIKEVYGVKYQYLEGTNTRVLFDEKVTYTGNGEFNETPTILLVNDIPSMIHIYSEEEDGKRFATLYKDETECLVTFIDNDDNITTYPLNVFWDMENLSIELSSENSAKEQFNIADKKYNFTYYYRKFIDNIIAEAGGGSGSVDIDPTSIIDDSRVSETTVYSSSKIEEDYLKAEIITLKLYNGLVNTQSYEKDKIYFVRNKKYIYIIENGAVSSNFNLSTWTDIATGIYGGDTPGVYTLGCRSSYTNNGAMIYVDFSDFASRGYQKIRVEFAENSIFSTAGVAKFYVCYDNLLSYWSTLNVSNPQLLYNLESGTYEYEFVLTDPAYIEKNNVRVAIGAGNGANMYIKNWYFIM